MSWLLSIIAIPSLIFNLVLIRLKHATKSDPGVAVISVYDGDTMILDNKTRLRLRQLDAPELEYCGGSEAKAALEKLVAGKRIRITEQVPDQQGRGMALVYVDDILVNQELLAQGWVRYHHDTTTKTGEFKIAAENAKSKNLGVFGKCQSLVNTKNPKCVIKGNIDRTRKTYHLPGCVQYKFAVVEEDMGEQWFCNEKSAQAAGYIKSERCP